VEEEWKRVHCLVVEMVPVTTEIDLRHEILAKLDSGLPVCIPVDLYFLSHTPHRGRLHQDHYVNIFGYDNGRYYMVCPYYRFMGWVDSDLIHSSFFSPVIEDKNLLFVPELRVDVLPSQKVYSLVQESCRYMLGLAIPEALADMNPQHLGLAGIRTLSSLLQELAAEQVEGRTHSAFLNLSRQLMWVGYSRYWFHRLMRTCHECLLPTELADEFQRMFDDVAQSWRQTGVRLGAGVHGGRPNMVEQSVFQLKQVYRQEERLFNNLIGALPDYEEGKL
jgi:hypothetical protein